MIIQINEKGTKEFYKEIISVSYMYSRLIKHPTKKCVDIFKYYTRLLITCLLLGTLCYILSFYSIDSYTMYLVLAAIMLFSSLISFAYLLIFNKSLKLFLQDDALAILTLDEEGIQLEKSGNLYKIAWKNVALIKSFKESICIMVNENSKIIISITKKYEDQIFKYIADNGIECGRIQQE